MNNYQVVNKSYRDYYILLNTLIKIKDNLKNTAPKRERRNKEEKVIKRIEKTKEQLVLEQNFVNESLSIKENQIMAGFDTINLITQTSISKVDSLAKALYRKESVSSTSSSQKSTYIQNPLIKVEFSEKKDKYINPNNTMILTKSKNSKISDDSENDEFVQLYHEDELEKNNEFDKVLDEFYSLD
jgi:hypothetical protein